MENRFTWPMVVLLALALLSLLVLLLRADMGEAAFYSALFPVYILGFAVVTILLVLAMFMGIAWCFSKIQRSDNAHIAEAAKWKALAAQANAERAAITNPGRLIESTAEPVDEASWHYQLADSGGGLKWVE